MWLWRGIAAFFHTWYGTIAGTVGILATIYNGVPTMFKSLGFPDRSFLGSTRP